MDELIEFRHQKDAFFRTDPHSPLTPDQQDHFEGLRYFEPNPDLDLTVEVDEFDDEDSLQMETTTGGVQTYRRFGTFEFEVDGETAQLTIFHNQNGFFLPFVDSQAGDVTYPAGRYLEPEQLPDGRFHIDFNHAYNPYCAYNEAWTCPITPPENRIAVPVQAGEKTFEDHP